jgi:hypothetical protein
MKIQTDFRDLVITDSSEWVTFRSPGEELVVVTKPTGFEIKYQGVWYTLRDGVVIPITGIAGPVIKQDETVAERFLKQPLVVKERLEPIPEVIPIIHTIEQQDIFFRRHNCHTTEIYPFPVNATDSEIRSTLIKEYGPLRHWWRAGDNDPLK